MTAIAVKHNIIHEKWHSVFSHFSVISRKTHGKITNRANRAKDTHYVRIELMCHTPSNYGSLSVHQSKSDDII